MDIPQDLTGLSDEDLRKIQSDIIDAGKTMQKAGVETDEQVEELDGLVANHKRIAAELDERATNAERIAESVGAAMKELGLGDDGEGSDDAGDNEGADEAKDPKLEEPAGDIADLDPDAAAPAPVPVAAATQAGTQASSAAGPKDGEEAAVADTPAGSAAAGTAVDVIDQLNQQNPATFVVAGSDGDGSRTLARFRDAGAVNDMNRGKVLDHVQMAGLVIDKYRQFNKLGGDRQVAVLATATEDFGDRMLTRDSFERNFSVMSDAVREQTGGEALVAAGASCAPYTPYYDIFHVAEPMSPVEGAFPTVGAPRGGIRYVRPPVWTQAQAGVRFTTNQQNENGYTGHGGTTAPKPCVHLQCTDVLECEVDAISACVSIDNLQSMTFDELVQVFLDDLAIAQAQTKEVYYLDTLEAGSTKVTFTPSYGMYRALNGAIGLAVHAYRKRNHMPLDAPIDWLAPDTMVPALAWDMANDHALGLGAEFRSANQVQVARELFSKYGVNVTWYYDFSTAYGSKAAMQTAQTNGALNQYPTVFRNYFFAPGTWVRLDGGNLNLGVVRDSTLNSINDFQIFSEEWLQLCRRGSESIQLDLTLCPSGVGPTPAAALACHS